MNLFIIGGTASGKSEYAERCAEKLAACDGRPVVYAATMRDCSGDAAERIERHRKRRGSTKYETFECFSLSDAERLSQYAAGRTVLFDCISGFTADVIFDDTDSRDAGADQINEVISAIAGSCRDIVIVADDVFADGKRYDELTMKYIDIAGNVCRAAAESADTVTEVVCGIPVMVKGYEKII